jgi:hypothetical protein
MYGSAGLQDGSLCSGKILSYYKLCFKPLQLVLDIKMGSSLALQSAVPVVIL